MREPTDGGGNDGQPLLSAKRCSSSSPVRLERGASRPVAVLDTRLPLGPAMTDASLGLSNLLGSPSGEEVLARGAVYLDIETTGLNPGAGTLVFLIGLGFVDTDEFVVRQYILHDPASEFAYLQSVANVISHFDCIITFNGKRFDVPMLEARYILHRLSIPTPRHHLDLLRPARQIWSRRLQRSTLAVLEERVLGIARDGDVAGHEIPGRYFAFLRGQSADLIDPIIAHNRQDVCSLAQLAGVMARLLHDERVARSSSPSDLLGLGRLLEGAGHLQRAERYYEAALIGASPTERVEALTRLATLARKFNELDRAIQIYEAVSAYSTTRAATAAIELAKIYEHRVSRPDRALVYARRALDLLQLRPSPRTESIVRELSNRIARLESKAGRLKGATRG